MGDDLTLADVEMMSAEQLIAMERDRWTPAEVRLLIRRYRELARVVMDLRIEAQEARDALREGTT